MMEAVQADWQNPMEAQQAQMKMGQVAQAINNPDAFLRLMKYARARVRRSRCRSLLRGQSRVELREADGYELEYTKMRMGSPRPSTIG
jgi:hypothetical protein